jgi:hypothetical protein
MEIIEIITSRNIIRLLPRLGVLGMIYRKTRINRSKNKIKSRDVMILLYL